MLRPRIESPQSAPQNFSKTLIVDFLKKGQYLGLNGGGVPVSYRRSMSSSEVVVEGKTWQRIAVKLRWE